MREEGQFIRWMMLVTFIIFGIARGIPAALILATPEPLPPVSLATQQRTYEGWAYRVPGDAYPTDILINTLVVSGTINYSVDGGCGRHQLDIMEDGSIG